ncbi:MAG: hypothetical protein EA397_17925 [Deltaproteobacteria bacterium]|nr:MAG: hypothetical protein EA397_17925 [Deltaproteobacteria bacterium]
MGSSRPLEDHEIPEVRDEFRLDYYRIWFTTAQRVLRGESIDDVRPTVLAAQLDAHHQNEIFRMLEPLELPEHRERRQHLGPP